MMSVDVHLFFFMFLEKIHGSDMMNVIQRK